MPQHLTQLSLCVYLLDWFVRKVVEGTATLAAIEKVETANERPVTPVTIANCGISKVDF